MRRQRLLISGASGHLGSHVLRELQGSSYDVAAWSGSHEGAFFGFPLQPVNLTDADAVATAFRAVQPDLVLHLAALSSSADCYRQPELADRINHQATNQLAELAADCQARLLYVSTDLVFDGEQGLYTEADEPHPLSVYGRSKRAGELAVLVQSRTLVVRVSLLLGSSLRPGRSTFFDQQKQALQAGQPIRCFADEWRTPLELTAAARILLRLLEWDWVGLLHVGGPERLSRLEMGQRLARQLGVAETLVQPIQRAELPTPEPRPRDTSLDSRLFRKHFPDEPWPAVLQAQGGCPA